MKNKIILIVLDSVGVGELPDAYKYNDQGSNTLLNIIKSRGKLNIPNLFSLGIGKIDGLNIDNNRSQIKGCYGKCSEKSPGKDTVTGHWEISGIILDKPFPTYPYGFPDYIINALEEKIGRKTLANKPASGTEIIKELGDLHVKTGYPIVYTSADSVLQIAAHEDIIPVEELYDYCIIARKLLTGKDSIGRVIARPFKGESGNYYRTERRKDFPLDPPEKTLLDILYDNNFTTAAVGKIEDIFNMHGIRLSNHTRNNKDGINATLDFMKENFNGLIFTNLVDFDMLYGHRNDVEGYAKALEYFDSRIPEIISCMDNDDILIITADHGCDPTTPSTDHSREYIPVIVYGKNIKPGINLGTMNTFSDIGATVAEYFNLKIKNGSSFLNKIK